MIEWSSKRSDQDCQTSADYGMMNILYDSQDNSLPYYFPNSTRL